MDTFKDKQHLDEMWLKGVVPWGVWRKVPKPAAG